MKQQFPHFSGYLIGSGNLLLQCANLLLSRSFWIKGIISPDQALKKWAQENQLPYFQSLSELDPTAFKETDYLFSIVNDEVIPTEILQSVRHVMNYHNALLPRYAGLHATSWALLQGETTHGITWHFVNETIDGGDILKQVSIPISPDETAVSLNLKCFEEALRAFSELIDELIYDTVQTVPQDLTQRTYFARAQKPVGNGWIDWSASAQDIEKTCRALQFGQYPNAFSLPKFLWEEDLVVIDKLEILSSQSHAQPGTVLAIEGNAWKVATGSQDVLVSPKIHQTPTIGTRLPLPEVAILERFTQLSSELSPFEPFWVKTLAAFEATQLDLSGLTEQASHAFLASQKLPDGLQSLAST